MKVSYSTLDESKIRELHKMVSSAIKGTLIYIEKNKSKFNPQAYNETRLGLLGLLEQNKTDLKESLFRARQYRRMVI